MLKKRFQFNGKSFRLFDSVTKDEPQLSRTDHIPNQQSNISASISPMKSKRKSTSSPSNQPEILTCIDDNGNFYFGDMVRYLN